MYNNNIKHTYRVCYIQAQCYTCFNIVILGPCRFSVGTVEGGGSFSKRVPK